MAEGVGAAVGRLDDHGTPALVAADGAFVQILMLGRDSGSAIGASCSATNGRMVITRRGARRPPTGMASPLRAKRALVAMAWS